MQSFYSLAVSLVLASVYRLVSAETFGDDAVADMIMKEKNPHTQKHYGRQIFAFKPEVWEPLCKDVVKKGNIAKFSQNEDLKQKLFSTYPKTLVEASPNDTVWGIGLSAENPDALQKETWRGTNLLGYILTDVRDQMLKEINFI